MHKYTRGPWSRNTWTRADTDLTIGAQGTPLIATVPLRDVSINEQKANAQLIEKAPELLERLESLVAWLRLHVYAGGTDAAELDLPGACDLIEEAGGDPDRDFRAAGNEGADATTA